MFLMIIYLKQGFKVALLQSDCFKALIQEESSIRTVNPAPLATANEEDTQILFYFLRTSFT